jgi:hypothetical protein
MTTSKNNLAGPSGSAAVGSLDSVLPVSPHRHRTVAGSLEQAGANSPLRGGPSAVVPPLRVYSRSRFRSKHVLILGEGSNLDFFLCKTYYLLLDCSY